MPPGQAKKNESKLEQLLAKSRCIYEFAVDGEWEKAVALESERKSLMDLYFSSQVVFEDTQAATRYIQEIIALDKKVIIMGKDAQKTLGGSLGDLQRGRQAAQAYQRVGS